METDADLKRDVEAELAWDPAVKVLGLKVKVRDGEVTLAGRVPAYTDRCAVEKLLQRLNGARSFKLDIEVVLAPEDQRADAEIAQAARAALQWSAPSLLDDVHISVDDGWLTLDGEVDRPSLRKRVEEAMRDLAGLVGLSNRIKVPGAAAAGASARAQHAFLR
ncbi:BON domain-containing protein [Azohydromonas lata]|uniref:BON domain-containing protein n=1 Tax=Azohydromonas lata TaxID=45677 RepID=A0ABU5IQY4_9BURK|nr:BON domain-containing protein [Azohydromonas lata]MDZ5461299.1 BON domain-containing protein [Azohydromonas lata]